MNEHDWLIATNVGSMLRYLTHEVHKAPEEAIGDYRREQPLISQRKLELFEDACFARFGLNLDDLVVQTHQPDGAADLLRCIVPNPFRAVIFEERWRTPTVLALARVAYEDRPGRKCEKCDGKGRIEWHPTRVDNRSPLTKWDKCPDCNKGRIEDGALDPLALAALADALEEAGCDEVVSEVTAEFCSAFMYGCEELNAMDACTHKKTMTLIKRDPNPILAHLRSPGPHVRGCWAVDLILGRE